MAKFDAATAVDQLEFDFTVYGGGSGVIPEPSTGAVNKFQKQMKSMVKELTAMQQSLEGVNLEELDGDTLSKQMDLVDEASEGASRFQEQTIGFIAELCSNSPSVNDLQTLPYRVLQAFSAWLMDQIRPKRTTPGTNG